MITSMAGRRVLHHRQAHANVPLGPPPGFDPHPLWSTTFRTISCFELQEVLGQGSYGVVYHARDRATGEDVAIKRQISKESAWAEEVKYMWMCRNIQSIVKFKEIVLDDDDDDDKNPAVHANKYIYLVMELVEEGTLSSLVWDKSRDLNEHHARELMSQLLQGVAGLHSRGIIHQDLKTENVSLTRSGGLKICDLGVSRRFDHRFPVVRYMRPVVTRWYRAPELLMPGCTEYTPAIDIWSVGCIMAELICRVPFFQGETEEEQCKMIRDFLDSPETYSDMFPPESLSDQGYNLLTRMLAFDPRCRITAEEALRHPWFCEEK